MSKELIERIAVRPPCDEPKNGVTLTFEINQLTCEVRYTLRISQECFSRIKLDRFDRMLIAECAGSSSIADKLLALETIVRRIEEQK